MLRSILASLPKSRLLNASYSSSLSGEKWDLVAAVCVERKPVISPAFNDIQKQYKTYLGEIEFERSYKSDHEVRHELDLKQSQLLKKGDIDVESTLKQTAQDFADASVEELQKFQFGDRLTDADRKNDTKSLNRKLDRHLVLLTKQKLGDKSYFILPQGLRQDGETLRQTANRVLKDNFGSDLNALVYSNSPAGFYKYNYPKSKRDKEGTKGAKVFIYFARYNNGQVTNEALDYKWLDRSELGKELYTNYHRSLSEMLIEED